MSLLRTDGSHDAVSCSGSGGGSQAAGSSDEDAEAEERTGRGGDAPAASADKAIGAAAGKLGSLAPPPRTTSAPKVKLTRIAGAATARFLVLKGNAMTPPALWYTSAGRKPCSCRYRATEEEERQDRRKEEAREGEEAALTCRVAYYEHMTGNKRKASAPLRLLAVTRTATVLAP